MSLIDVLKISDGVMNIGFLLVRYVSTCFKIQMLEWKAQRIQESINRINARIEANQRRIEANQRRMLLMEEENDLYRRHVAGLQFFAAALRRGLRRRPVDGA